MSFCGTGTDAVHTRTPKSRDDWRTPDHVVDAVRRIFGGKIDLDPCASESSADWIADVNYNIHNDGLFFHWFGNTYINPPYGRALLEWSWYGVEQFRASVHHDRDDNSQIWLVPARPDTRWWRILMSVASIFAVYNKRLRFKGARDCAAFPSALVLLTDDALIRSRFVEVLRPDATFYEVYE